MTRPSTKFLHAGLVPLACLAALTLSACGGDNGSDPPDEVVKEFSIAVADGDAGTACGFLTEDALQKAEDEGTSCEDGVAQAAAAGGEDSAKQAADATYEVTGEDGDTATVNVTGSNGESSFNLVNEDGDWKISG